VLTFSASLERETQNLPLTDEHRQFMERQALNLGGAKPPPGLVPGLAETVETVIDDAFVDAFRAMMGLCGVLALASALVAALTISNNFDQHHHADKVVRFAEGSIRKSDDDFSGDDGRGPPSPGGNGRSHYAMQEQFESFDRQIK